MMFSFSPILKALPMPEGIHHPRRAVTDVVDYQGHELYRVVLHGPDDSPSCFGLGPTPESALRAGLVGLFGTMGEHGISDLEAAVAYAQRLTLN